VLARPDTGIIFGFAGGTHVYALRLPPAERAELAAAALRRAAGNADRLGLRGPDRDRYVGAHAGNVHVYSNDSSLDVSSLGDGWALCRWLDDEPRWCRAAYEYATASGR